MEYYAIVHIIPCCFIRSYRQAHDFERIAAEHPSDRDGVGADTQDPLWGLLYKKDEKVCDVVAAKERYQSAVSQRAELERANFQQLLTNTKQW